MTPDQRSAFLESLDAGLPIPRALSGAFDGYIPVKAWSGLQEMRREGGEAWDREVAEACEESERRARDDGAKQVHQNGPEDAEETHAFGDPDRHLLPSGGGRPEAQGEEATTGHDSADVLGDDGRSLSQESVGRAGGAPGAAVAAEPDTVAVPIRAFWGATMPETDAAQEIRPDPTPFDLLLQVDASCSAYGMPPLSPWWLYALGCFYRSGKPWGIFLVGRGGGKSTSLERVAASDAYHVTRKIPPGQVWTWPFISIGPDDSNRRVDGIEAVYRAVGRPFVGDETGGVDQNGKPVKVKDGEGVGIVHSPRAALSLKDAIGNAIKLMSIAGTIGNISGPSTIGLTVDEAAKLHDKSEHVNPLTEIIASGAQTSRGRAGWRAIVCSSAWEEGGTHADLAIGKDGNARHTATNFVATIGEEFLADALRGFEEVARWEKARGEHEAANRIREHAARLTADSPMVPTWVANPTIGSPTGEAWSGAALATRMLVEVLPEQSLGGIPRILYWLRENGSLPMAPGGAVPGPLADVEIPIDERPIECLDVVIGVAPPDEDSPEWGLVAVGLAGTGGLLVVEDASGTIDGREAAGRVRALCVTRRASVLAVAKDAAGRVEGEILAAYAGVGVPLAPVAPQDVRDAAGLRVGPLRTLYQRWTLRHGEGLEALAAAARGWTPDRRAPRVEALLAAVARLVACYPWLDATVGQPMHGPRAVEATYVEGMGARGMDLVRRLGGRG